jgi:hypothetical protein
VGTLGCAQSYQAAIHWQGGKHLFAPLDGVTQVTWGRKLDDYSEASVTLAKGTVSPQCWQKITPKADGTRPGIEPWAHELSIYRDRQLVWQGPVVEWSETRDHIELLARDVLAWMDRRVVDLNLEAPPGGDPNSGQQRYKGRTGDVLRSIFERTWPATHEINPWDNPGITEHARIDVVDDRWTETENVWKGSRTVGELVRDVIKNGYDLFALGRKVYALPDYISSDLSRSPYRLTEEHILGDIEVRKLGLDMATEGFVAAAPENAGENAPPLYGKWPPDEGPGHARNAATPAWYGRITRFHEPTSLGTAQPDPPPDPNAPPPPPPQNPSPALQQVARAIREYGFPCPVAVIVPSQAALSSTAPITIGQLVPGRVVMVELTSFVNHVQDVFRINEIEVTWENSESTSGGSGSSGGSASEAGSTASTPGGPERVQVSLVTLRTPPVPNEAGGTSTSAA